VRDIARHLFHAVHQDLNSVQHLIESAREKVEIVVGAR